MLVFDFFSVRPPRILWITALACTLLLLGAADQERDDGPASQPAPSFAPLVLPPAPSNPDRMPSSSRPTVVLLSAPWCQWCKVLETKTLPHPLVQDALREKFDVREVDVEQQPLWMDLPEVSGLPTLVFFDRQGRHVLSKSGYRTAASLVVMLEEIHARLDRGEMPPYRTPGAARVILGADVLTPPAATSMLNEWERALFFIVNSNEGGFLSPARHPFPELLLALGAWADMGAPARVSSWISLTTHHAMMGSSPRLRRDPQPDFNFSRVELVALSAETPPYSPRWYAGVEELPTMDPHRGLRDPVDAGFFRYATRVGWYDPHYERNARDNMAWVALLRRQGETREARRTESFVLRTFVDDVGVRASQTSDPFYFRLRAEERKSVPAPKVSSSHLLDTEAAAAMLWGAQRPQFCASLLRVPTSTWPPLHWPPETPSAKHGADIDDDDAPPDVVGVFLKALTTCGPEGRRAARDHANTVVTRFESTGFPSTARLFSLVDGLCHARPDVCGRALSTLRDLKVDPAHPPPFVHVARIARR